MLATSSHADEAEIDYYDVSGNSAKELRDQMRQKGPFGKDGKRYDARTDWHVSWNYRYQPFPEGCRFTELQTTFTVTIILPNWSSVGASAALVRKWERYMSALRLHEDGHQSNGVKAAEEIQALQSLRSSAGCPALMKEFQSKADSIFDKYRAADDAYDASTGHGRSQGATFP